MDLRNEYDAVYIAIGAHIDRKMGIEGEDAEGVISAVEMLRGIGDDEMPDFTGKDIVVIGGGNVAMDVARSAVRLGAKRVRIAYRRRAVDMTAMPEEVEGARRGRLRDCWISTRRCASRRMRMARLRRFGCARRSSAPSATDVPCPVDSTQARRAPGLRYGCRRHRPGHRIQGI